MLSGIKAGRAGAGQEHKSLFSFPSKADGKTRADLKCSVEKDNCSFFVSASACSKKNPGVFRVSKNTCAQRNRLWKYKEEEK